MLSALKSSDVERFGRFFSVKIVFCLVTVNNKRWEMCDSLEQNTYDPLGEVFPEINADEIGDTFDEDLLDSLWASRNIRR